RHGIAARVLHDHGRRDLHRGPGGDRLIVAGVDGDLGGGARDQGHLSRSQDGNLRGGEAQGARPRHARDDQVGKGGAAARVGGDRVHAGEPGAARGNGGGHADPLRAHRVAVRILDLQHRLLGEGRAALRRARGRRGEGELASGGRGDVEGAAGAAREPRGRGGEGIADTRLINSKAGETGDAAHRRLSGSPRQRSSTRVVADGKGDVRGEPGGRVPEAVARRDLDRRSDRRAGGRAAGLAGEDEALGGRGRNRERVAGRGEGRAAERGTRLQRVAGTHVRDAQIG